MSEQKVLIAGEWRKADSTGTFSAVNPATKEPLPEVYPKSSWADCDAALDAAVAAADELRHTPVEKIGQFLDKYADRIEARAQEITQLCNLETGYPLTPRLADVELPRTVNQLRQAATAAREGSWALATIDSVTNIRSCLAPLGPVAVFGPNNFPLAFGSASGGDFAAAIAAGNPVIAKAHSSHPGTTRLFAEEAKKALEHVGLHPATVQLIYAVSHDIGFKLVSDPRIEASGFTGSRTAGLALKEAADKAGKLMYVELSSINPLIILPGALRERKEKILEELVTSALMGSGQFCTNPGMIVLQKSAASDDFIAQLTEKYDAAPVGTLLSSAVYKSLTQGIQNLCDAGAELLTKKSSADSTRICHANTLLKVSGQQFLANSEALQTEAFGNASLLVVADDAKQIATLMSKLEGNLTGCIYSDTQGSDEDGYAIIAPVLRNRVGRLLNDKMPTGVAVSPAMNHGGRYPSTGHPGFTAVGIPASLRRFAMLQCYDNVRHHRLPPLLANTNPTGKTWRLIDGRWTTSDVQK